MEFNEQRLTKAETKQANRNLTILVVLGVLALMTGVIQ